MAQPPHLPCIDYYPSQDLNIPAPVEKRIRAMMEGARPPLPKPSAREVITSLGEQLTGAMSHISFHQDEGDMPPIAELWTTNSYRLRSHLYASSKEIVDRTGWSMYVQGMHVPEDTAKHSDLVGRALANRDRCYRARAFSGLGMAKSIEPTYGHSIMGNSQIVDADSCMLLLDCGRNSIHFNAISMGKETLVLVSHAHDDHIGNLRAFIEDGTTHIGIGRVTLELFMDALEHDENVDVQDYFEKYGLWPRLLLLDYRDPISFADGSIIEVMDVDHFMGSMAFALTFRDGKRLLYSGDFSCRSRYTQLLRSKGPSHTRPETLAGKFDVALLDASLVSRQLPNAGNNSNLALQSIPSTQTSEDMRAFLEKMLNSDKHCILLAPPRDYGLYTFLYLYDILIDQRSGSDYRPIFVDEVVLRHLALLEWHAKADEKEHMDSFMREFAHGQNLYSSARVFQFLGADDENVAELLTADARAAFILDPQKVADPAYLTDAMISELTAQGLGVGLVGKAGLEYSKNPNPRLKADKVFDASRWMLHSTNDELKSFIERRRDDFGKVLLFHATDKRTRIFIGNLAPDVRKKCAVANERIAL